MFSVAHSWEIIPAPGRADDKSFLTLPLTVSCGRVSAGISEFAAEDPAVHLGEV